MIASRPLLIVRTVIGVLAISALLASLPAAETTLDVLSGKKWAFYPGYEFPGAKGTCRLESVDNRDALVIEYDFTGGGAYVLAGTPVEIAQGPAELRFDVKADREMKIIVRIEDSEKQTHQYNLLSNAAGEWETLTVDLAKPANKSFGGPADGVIHYPITKFSVAVGKGKTTTEPGTAAISNIRTAE
jgi:hypothetical protein